VSGRTAAVNRRGVPGGARGFGAGKAVYRLPVNDWKNYDAKIDAVTIGQLRDFARRYFTSEQRVELIVRP
jgi:predicted Zn-dependent peptidase